ncbi:putative short chain dehydrogenase/ reductase [Astrocystis sublimbata]|nr:putative short chain dehydrogenase/ reductase [Astrocystis sublimbata]
MPNTEPILICEQTVLVCGGSSGLGAAVAKQLAACGAHITIFGRSQDRLNSAQKEIEACAATAGQEVRAIPVDLSNAQDVETAFRAQPRLPDELYCCAGGNHAENGFFVDLKSSQLDSCMKNNYYAALYPAKAVIDQWLGGDSKVPTRDKSHLNRRIVFVSSCAAFLSMPGSLAYTPAKAAVRALADSLRMELLRYSSSSCTYSIHCAFPGDFKSPGFYLEQDTKTPLTKRIQGTNHTLAVLEARCPSSDQVASQIIEAAESGEFIICRDSTAASLLFTAMTGPSPKRGWGIFDSFVSLFVGWFVWPYLRRQWETEVRKDGETARGE